MMYLVPHAEINRHKLEAVRKFLIFNWCVSFYFLGGSDGVQALISAMVGAISLRTTSKDLNL